MNLSDWVIVFDLDDTLISEIDYQRSGILAVENGISSIYNVSFEGRIQEALDDGVQDVFGWACEQLGLPSEVKTSFLWMYRLHSPKIQLFDGVQDLVSQLLSLDANLAVLTDGRSISQRLKLIAIGLDSLPLFVSEEYQSEKPSADRYIVIERRWPNCKYAYIADNAQKDFLAPRSRNWLTLGALWVSPRVHHSNCLVTAKNQPHKWLHSPSQVVSAITSK